LVLKESIAGTAWIGLALIVGGISVAAYRPSQSWKFSDNKGVWIVLSASLLSGVIALIDKQIAPLMDPNLYTAIVYTVPGVMILGFINKERIDESVAVLKDGARTGFVVAAGIINGLTFIFTLYAYRHFDLHIAYPIIQTASVLTVLAGIIFFKERERIGWKLLGLTLALIGSFIIKVW
jgi:drug/metabolite transporter (DMT)-like permease